MNKPTADPLHDVPSPPTATKRTAPRIVIIFLVGVLAIMVTWFSPLGSQKRNLLAAQKHVNLTRPQIRLDPRFTKVKITAFTGAGGSLLIGGSVDSEEDGKALRKTFASTHPPVRTLFRVYLSTPTGQLSGFIHLTELTPGGF